MIGGVASASAPTNAGEGDDELIRCTPPVISANHGHLTVFPADVTAGAVKTYSIQGGSSHGHQVTISAAQFAQLRAGTTLTLTSITDAEHVHTVKVICA